MNEKGFTLIELVVVIGILSLLSASLITYSRSGEKQIIFFKEQSVLTASIFRAKNLAISTYGRGGANSCGYGIYIPDSGDKIIIFSDLLRGASSCEETDKKYTGSDENADNPIILDSRVKIKSFLGNSFLFIPPDPTVYPKANVDIRLELADDQSKSATISVSSAGQITVK